MEAKSVSIEGILVIQPRIFRDARGYFFEVYHKDKFRRMGLDSEFIQDNESRSLKNTIRGLHYQIDPHAQGKLIRVLEGTIRDVSLDIRKGSPTYGEHFSIDITAESLVQLWIPPGFAHGFSVLSDAAVLLYKCTSLYSPEHERGILYNDPSLSIDWGVETPIVSDKDMALPRFEAADINFKYR